MSNSSLLGGWVVLQNASLSYGDDQPALFLIRFSVHEVPEDWTGQTVRSAVVELLQEMSQSTLAALSPLSQVMQ